MTELSQFLRILYRNKLTIILVPLLTVVACYFLVKELPDQYKSHGSIATGLVDKTDQGIMNTGTEQDFEIARKFDNLIQMMSLKKVIDVVSYQLLIHDLKAPESDDFRNESKLLSGMGAAERKTVLKILTQKYKTQEELFPERNEERKIQEVLAEMEYDAAHLQKKLSIFRLSNSDYISIDFEAENPFLASFVINTLSNEFINLYSARLANNSDKTISFLADFLNQKRVVLHEQMNELKNYKIKNRVLNLDEQAKSLYGQMAEFEIRQEVAEKDIVAYAAAIKNIDAKFKGPDRNYLETALAGINQEIVLTKQRLRSANELYVKSNFDPKYKAKVDSIQKKLSFQIAEATDKNIYSPLVVKEELVSQKMTMEIARDLAVNSVASIKGELNRLNAKFDGLVPNEAKVQEFETAIDIASKEYIEALQKYNDARLASSFPVQLKIAERALPGRIQPSKKIVLVILSGVISLVFCLVVFLVLYFLDGSIRYPQQLADATDRPVLGYLNNIKGSMDMSQLDGETSHEKRMQLYRNLIRSIRFELMNEGPGTKLISITSLKEGNGKTILTLSLAWAFSKISKKVLIIDGNSRYSEITKIKGGSLFIEDYLVEETNEVTDTDEGAIYFLGNKGADTSLFEIAKEERINMKLNNLMEQFDIILVETDSLESMNKAKEWISFSDIVVAVFGSGNSVSTEDKAKIDYLKNLNGKFAGWVLTGIQEDIEQTGKITKRIAE